MKHLATIFSRRVLKISAAALVLSCAASTSAHAEKLNVVAIYTLHVEQQWISRIHNALVAAEERGAIDYTYFEDVNPVNYAQAMREQAAQGPDLLVGEIFPLEKAGRAVAKEFPHIPMLMGSARPPQEPNLSVFDNYIHEPSYLSGIVAGSKTETGLIGMVGGYPIPEVNRLMHAFMAGARSVQPDIDFFVAFLNSWYAPEKAKTIALRMIDNGADILYAERYGVTDAAVERGVLAVGNVFDTAADYPGTMLASALWHMEPTINRALAAVRGGTYAAKDYSKYSFMRYGGGSLVVDENMVDPEVLARVKEVEAAILDKTFTVAIVDGAPRSTKREYTRDLLQ